MNKELKQLFEKLKMEFEDWNFKAKQSAINYLETLTPKDRKIIFKKINQAAKNPKKIPRLKGTLKDYRKIKVDDHRIIVFVKFHPNGMNIIFAGNRKSVYKEFERKI